MRAARGIGAWLLIATLLGFGAACRTTVQARSVQPSGFLEDYSQLHPGKGDEALLLFIDPAAHFADFDRIVIDPVTLWHGEGSDLAELPRNEVQRLADYLETALRRELAHDFEIVDRAGPGTLRLRAAITEAHGSKVVLDLASTVLPPARLLSGVKKLATGTHAFVGGASIEVEILDSLSARRLIAGADRRAGGKTLEGSTGTWSDVEEAFDAWARAIAARLATFRQFDAAEASWEAEQIEP